MFVSIILKNTVISLLTQGHWWGHKKESSIFFFSIMLRLVTNPEASSAKPPEEASAKIRSGWRIEAILRISINCHIYKPAEAF